MNEPDAALRRVSPPASNGTDGPWAFLHPPHGTCVEGCPAFGTCHCGCAGRPKRSAVTYAAGSRYRDRPYVFVPGHHLRVVHPRAGSWSRNGVEVEKIRPLLLWLRERHGSIRAVAAILEVPESTLRGYVYNTKRKRVPAPAAKRIVSVVLAHRRPVDPFETWE